MSAITRAIAALTGPSFDELQKATVDCHAARISLHRHQLLYLSQPASRADVLLGNCRHNINFAAYDEILARGESGLRASPDFACDALGDTVFLAHAVGGLRDALAEFQPYRATGETQ